MQDLYYTDIRKYLQGQKYPPNSTESCKRVIRNRAKMYFIENGALYYQGRKGNSKLRVISDKDERKGCFAESHCVDGNHLTKEMTVKQISSKYYWKGIFADCNYMFSSCVKCNSKPVNSRYQSWNLVEVSVHGPYPVSGSVSQFILRIVDVNTNWTVLRTIPEDSISEIVHSICDVFFTFGWPAIINFVSANQLSLSAFLTRIENILEIAYSVHNSIESDGPGCEVPNFAVNILDIAGKTILNEILNKAHQMALAESEILCSTVFICESRTSYCKSDTFVWQKHEIEEFVGLLPEKWPSFLQSLAFKFNHTLYALNFKTPFTMLFRHLSSKIFPIGTRSASLPVQNFVSRNTTTSSAYVQKDHMTNSMPDTQIGGERPRNSEYGISKIICKESKSRHSPSNNSSKDVTEDSIGVAPVESSEENNALKGTENSTNNILLNHSEDGISLLSGSTIQSFFPDSSSEFERNQQDAAKTAMDQNLESSQVIHVTVIADEIGEFDGQSATVEASSCEKRFQPLEECDDNTGNYICGICSIKFSSEEEVQVHHKCHRLGEKSFSCPYCEHDAISWIFMFRHLVTHDIPDVLNLLPADKKKSTCTQCMKIFPSATSLKNHMIRIHKSRDLHYCDACNLIFKERKTYIRHIEQHSDTELRCSLCSYKTKSSRSFQLHQRKHNIEGSGHQCKICKKYFAIPSLLKSHMLVHDDVPRTVMCEQCGVIFKNIRSLKTHRVRIHGGTTRFPCHRCDYIGKSAPSLNSHIRRIHNKKYQCKQCDHRTTTSKALIKHEDMFHNTESRPYVCSLCSYRSKRSKQLTEHIRVIHNPNTKRFQCQFCNYKFKTIARLRDHLPVHTGELLYGCKICGYRAKHRQTVHAHIKAKHKDSKVPEALETPGPESLKLTKMMIPGNTESTMQQYNQSATIPTNAPVNSKTDQTMVCEAERATKEIVIDSNQTFLETQSCFPIGSLQTSSVLNIDQTNETSIVIHGENDNQMKIVQLDGSNSDLYTMPSDNQFVEHESDCLTFQESTLEIVNQV